MTELKTLKDMEFVDCMIGHPSDEVFRDILKQEAIKWIKAQEDVKECWDFCDEYGCDKQFIGWIKHFFNITEEDLK